MILSNVSGPSGIYFIEKLKPLKIYLVRARSRNLAGLSEPSNIVYLQTNRTFKPLGRGGRGYPYQVLLIYLNFCIILSHYYVNNFKKNKETEIIWNYINYVGWRFKRHCKDNWTHDMLYSIPIIHLLSFNIISAIQVFDSMEYKYVNHRL